MQNILMIHAERWDGRMLGCQNFHPAMKDATPNIDALQRGHSLCQHVLHESHLLSLAGEYVVGHLHSRVRKLEQLQGLVLRMFETAGRETKVTVTLPFFAIRRATATNLVEEGAEPFPRRSMQSR